MCLGDDHRAERRPPVQRHVLRGALIQAGGRQVRGALRPGRDREDPGEREALVFGFGHAAAARGADEPELKARIQWDRMFSPRV